MAQAQQPSEERAGSSTPPLSLTPQLEQVRSYPSSWGWLCAVLLGIGGLFNLFDGLIGLYNTHYYSFVASTHGVTLPVTYALRTWSWVAIAVGGAMILTAAGIVSGYLWARVLGVTIAGLSMVYQFGFLPAYPWWALAIMALDVIVIYGLVVRVRRIGEEELPVSRGRKLAS